MTDITSLRGYVEFLADVQKKNCRGEKISPAEWLLAHGRDFLVGPRTFAGRRMKMKECFRNAAQRALRDPGLAYAEGYVHAVIPIEHAWLVDKDGCVVDPTLRNGDGRVQNYFGVAIRTSYLMKTLSRNKCYGVLGYWNWEHVLKDATEEILP